MHDEPAESTRRDPREAAAEYRLAQFRREHPEFDPTIDHESEQLPVSRPAPASGTTAQDRAAYVETVIQQAIRRGDFDDLPGAGKPIPGLGERLDPDWWIRRKIQTEKLTGLGPPALTLRVESEQLEATLDGIAREDDVRDLLADFNRRVIEARRQLQGGPPVVTATRDIDAEVSAWRERRAAVARAAADAATDAAAGAARSRRRW
ncbi:MAG: DUF1992 domain-containing protein, partial [Microbacterium sp.]|nr:DUF1992 domain-containing protein [Microbacterium sp.]